MFFSMKNFNFHGHVTVWVDARQPESLNRAHKTRPSNEAILCELVHILIALKHLQLYKCTRSETESRFKVTPAPALARKLFLMQELLKTTSIKLPNSTPEVRLLNMWRLMRPCMVGLCMDPGIHGIVR